MKLISEETYIAHHGIKGQKWGVRRFRNEDGSLTSLGKKRYASDIKKFDRASKRFDKAGQKLVSRYRKVAGLSYARRLDPNNRTVRKAHYAKQKAVKANYKLSRIYESMDKRYGNENMANLGEDRINAGKAAVLRIENVSMLDII